MRIVKLGGLALAALIVAALGAVVLLDRLDQKPAPDPAALIAKGQHYQARIQRDEYGVPHISGPRDADVAFGLGYAHAEDDFATIQTVALATRGQLAARDGQAAAVTDYLVHLFRVWETIEARYDRDLPPELKAVLEAYADGINDYAAHHPGEVSEGLLPLTGKDIAAGFVFKTPFFYGLDKVLMDITAPKSGAASAKEGKDAFLPTEHPLPIGSNGVAVAPSRSADGATRLLVTAYIGIGNKLFIRGDGPGLSWDKDVPMQFVSIGKWGWASHDVTGPIACKLYKNDESAALSGEIFLEPGKHVELTALF